MSKTWFITGTSSGFGRLMTEKLLARGDTVVATLRRTGALDDLRTQYADRLDVVELDVTDSAAVRRTVDAAFAAHERIDVVVSNAGYGLFGAAEELTDEQIRRQIDTNLIGSMQLIRAALPHLRTQGGGRILQVASEGGQYAYPGFAAYHATKWGIEGFVESVAQEVAPFGIGMTLLEPGGARTEFRYGSARVAELMPIYDDTPAHSFLRMLDPESGLAPRRPVAHGRAHHRERGRGARTAAHGARRTGAGEHRDDAARADRRLRGVDRARRFH